MKYDRIHRKSRFRAHEVLTHGFKQVELGDDRWTISTFSHPSRESERDVARSHCCVWNKRILHYLASLLPLVILLPAKISFSRSVAGTISAQSRHTRRTRRCAIIPTTEDEINIVLPAGNYTIRQTVTPPNYEATVIEQQVQIIQNREASVVLENVPLVSVPDTSMTSGYIPLIGFVVLIIGILILGVMIKNKKHE